MTRNIYLGADVGAAVRLLPDVSAAAQSMWDDVRRTHFARRMRLLAREILAEMPDVIGLQEVARWFCRPDSSADPVEVHSGLRELLDALCAQYAVAVRRTNLSTAHLAPSARVHDPETFRRLWGPQVDLYADKAECWLEVEDVLLVRQRWVPHIVRTGSAGFARRTVLVPGLLEIDRGYVWADLDLDTQAGRCRVVSAHLESGTIRRSAAYRQARQLVRDLDDLSDDVLAFVVVGDFNSDRGGAYWAMRGAGFADTGREDSAPTAIDGTRTAVRGRLFGPDPPRGISILFTERIDYIFVRGCVRSGPARTVGVIPPLASDHAGVVVDLELLDP